MTANLEKPSEPDKRRGRNWSAGKKPFAEGGAQNPKIVDGGTTRPRSERKKGVSHQGGENGSGKTGPNQRVRPGWTEGLEADAAGQKIERNANQKIRGGGNREGKVATKLDL